MENFELREILSREFDLRQKQNPSFSLRAFAARLEMPSSGLSEFLNGYRNFSQKKIKTILKRLADISPLGEVLLKSGLMVPPLQKKSIDGHYTCLLDDKLFECQLKQKGSHSLSIESKLEGSWSSTRTIFFDGVFELHSRSGYVALQCGEIRRGFVSGTYVSFLKDRKKALTIKGTLALSQQDELVFLQRAFSDDHRLVEQSMLRMVRSDSGLPPPVFKEKDLWIFNG